MKKFISITRLTVHWGYWAQTRVALVWHPFYLESTCLSGIVQGVLRFVKKLNNLSIFKWLHLPLHHFIFHQWSTIHSTGVIWTTKLNIFFLSFTPTLSRKSDLTSAAYGKLNIFRLDSSIISIDTISQIETPRRPLMYNREWIDQEWSFEEEPRQ